jgi:hypothetical protein
MQIVFGYLKIPASKDLSMRTKERHEKFRTADVWIEIRY